jgi:hypothetical protein
MMRLAPAALACALLAAAPARAENTPLERTFLERAAITASDRACNLFSEGERFALASGLAQSEGELLRSGYARAKIDRLSAQVAAHARTLGCDHPSVREVAATIRDAYRQFQKTSYLEYPASHSLWAASRSEHDRWAVAQTDKASGAILGLRRGFDPARPADLRLALAIPRKGAAPAAAQLFMRDPKKMNEAWLGSLNGATDQLSAPPRSMARPEWAGEMRNETDSAGDPFRVFYFSETAAARFDPLDPREAVLVELTPAPRASDQTPTRILFEAGDFRAAANFVRIPQPTYAAPPEAVKASAKAAH